MVIIGRRYSKSTFGANKTTRYILKYSILNTPGKLRSARCSHPLAISILAESVPLWQDAQAAPHPSAKLM